MRINKGVLKPKIQQNQNQMKNRLKKGLLVLVVLGVTATIYSMRAVEEVGVCSPFCTGLPAIYPVGPSGPVTVVKTGSFIDFHDSPGPSTHSGGNFTWSSDQPIPGMTSSGGNRLLKTVYIPPTTNPGTYTVTATHPSGGCTCVQFEIEH